MREVTREQHELMYLRLLGKLITEFPCKGMPDGRRAHLECFVEHLNDEEIELGR